MRPFFTKLSIIACILLYTSASFAQNDNSSFAIDFKSGSQFLPNNLTQFIQQPDLETTEIGQAYFYRLIQFNDIPDLRQQNQIALAGIKLMEYIPNRAYIAAIPMTMNRQILSSLNVRAVVKLDASIKMNEALRYEVYPNWAVTGNEIELYVKLNDRIPSSKILSDFLAKGAKVIKVHTRDQLVHIKIETEAVVIRSIAAIPYVNFVEPISEPGEPEDVKSGNLHRSNMLKSNSPNGVNYDGTGVKVLVRDNSLVGPHIDFEGRQTTIDFVPTGTHGDNVASCLTSAGNLDPDAEGSAPGAYLYVSDYEPDFLDTVYGLHLYDNVKVTNSSYSDGCNGGYTNVAQRVDDQINDSPTLLHVFSAGNSGTTNCQYGAGNVWGNITGGHKVGKNVMTVGSTDANGVLVASSSRGPAEDGRIKPDIVTHGSGVYMTMPNNTYTTASGTSFSAPNIAGLTAQLIHAYKDLNAGQEPESALIKAAVLNTAKDFGNYGPDFRYGWGLANGYKAYKLLEENRYLTASVAQGGSNAHNITVPANVSELKVMVYWREEGGSLTAASPLVNNLDMTVLGNGTTYQPFVLDPTPNATTLNNPAVQGVDNLNNMEQVAIVNPSAGTYTVNVAGTVVPTGTREYYVLYEFVMNDVQITYPSGGEGIVASTVTRIQWDAFGAIGTFDLEYSTDNGTTWNTIATAPATAYFYDWTVPASVTDQGLVRITRGTASDMSDTTFTVVGVPSNISVDTVCANVVVSWTAVPGATSYDVLVLGQKYMDSVANSTTTSAIIPLADPTAPFWVTVRSRVNDGVGKRAYAINHAGGLLNCVLAHEVAIELNQPTPQESFCSFDSTIVIELANNGQSDLINLPVYYQLGNNTPVMETITDTIFSGQTYIHTFSSLLNVPLGSHTIKTWFTYPQDLLNFNDTSDVAFDLAGSVLVFNEDFETFTNCAIANDCDLTVCPLTNGWRNFDNGTEDDIDWRVDNNGTASNGTGPNVDFNPGTAAGKYLYLEASGTCNNQEASLISPCIDLTNATNPLFLFGYHMLGNDIGELHIDIISDVTTLDVIPPFIGAQGNDWNQGSIDLSPYVGTTISIRLRGITGNGFASDIAIDGLELIDINTPPSTSFSYNQSIICPGENVLFTDESTNYVSSYQWSFTPNTVTYLNGTSATSANPAVSFNTMGTYDVTLITTNLVGSDTLVQTAAITVGAGMSLPIANDFESYANCGTANNCELEVCALGNGWKNLANGSEDDIDWRVDDDGTLSNNTGPSVDFNPGTTQGNYLFLEASGGCNNQTASLVSPCIDLTSAVNPAFTLAYHMFGNDMGSLHIDIYSNGQWINDVIPSLTDNVDLWQQLQVSLFPYVGQSISVRVRGLTGSGFEADLAIDDINIFEVTTPPTAALSISGTPCFDATTFNDNSTNGATSWNWNFGPNAIPATANTAGPHTVAFSSAGAQTVTLIASSPSGSDTVTQQVNLDTLPTADFSWTAANEAITFSNNSSSNGTTYSWAFGDGSLSTIANPGIKIFGSSGVFPVTLTVANACGSSSVTKNIEVIVTDVYDVTKNWDISVFPNPNNGQFTLSLDGISGKAQISITDITGKQIRSWNYKNIGSGWNTAIDVEDVASGIYLLNVQTETGVKNVKLFID